jgi:hypothetical protein
MTDHHLGNLRERRVDVAGDDTAVHRIRDGQAVSRDLHEQLLS